MNEIDKAREAAISTFKNKYPRVIGDAPYAPQVVNAFEEGYDAGYATATAKIEALEAKLAAAERLINEINDARASNWHLQRRRENDQFEWFSSTADSVFGPFPTALEAFAAVRQENTDA